MKLRMFGGALGLLFMSCSSGGSGDGDPPDYRVPRWLNQQRTPTFSDLRAVRFNTPTQGFVAGLDSSIYRTDDGGLTWVQSETVPAERGGRILGLDFLGFSVHAVGTDEGGTLGRFWTSADGLNFSTADAAGSGSIFVSVDVTTDPDGGAPFLNWYLRENWDIRLSQGAGVVNVDTINKSPDKPTTQKAKAIDMLFDGRGMAVGEGGLMYETVDYFNNVTLRTGAGANHLYDVQVAGASIHFACGAAGTIVWTDEGGNLSALVAPPTAATFRGLHFDHIDKTSSVGWAVGDGGVIYKFTGTYNAPTWTWTSSPQTSNTSEDLYDVHFVDRNNGYAVGNKGTVVRTTNGGTTWTVVTRGSVETINAVSFDPTGVVGVAAGDAGKVYVTLNGGSTWTESDFGNMTWTGVAIPPGNPNVAYVCGLDGNLRRNLNLSGGGSWDPVTDVDVANKDLRAILFPSSADVGFVVGDGSTLLYTNDGMTAFSWQAPAGVPAADYKAICLGIKTSGGLTLFAAGSGGVVAEQALATYALAWTQDLSANRPTSDISAVQAGGVDFLVVATPGGLARRLAGVWSPASAPAAPAATGLAFPTSSLGWYVSDKIYTTENGAFNLMNDWKLSPAHTSSTLKAVWMNQTGTIGYAVGTQGLILKTISGGK